MFICIKEFILSILFHNLFQSFCLFLSIVTVFFFLKYCCPFAAVTKKCTRLWDNKGILMTNV